MITNTHTEILRRPANRPLIVIHALDPRVQSGGHVAALTLALPDLVESALQLLILQAAGSWVAIQWTEPTTVVGVQFWGDHNDGFARLLVDGTECWRGNTCGASVTFEQYIEIAALPNSSHTVQVETIGSPGSGGGSDVTVAAFGWGPVTSPLPHQLHLPIVSNG